MNKTKNFLLSILLPMALAAVCLLAAVLSLRPLLSAFSPLMGEYSGYDLLAGDNSQPGRFTALSDAPPTPAPGETVDMAALGGWPEYGEEIGRLTVSGTTVDTPLYYGDGDTQLHYGAGIWKGATIPGEPGTVLVAGHTATWFRDFESAEVGALVTLTTYWGEYVYEIVDMQVAEAGDTTAYDLERADENIILYTCWPFNTLGYTQYRYFIYGEPVSGPLIEGTGEGGTA